MRVRCAGDVRHSVREIRGSTLFRRWEERVSRVDIDEARVLATYAWNGEIRMVQMEVEYGGFNNAVLLRGGTVNILTVVTDGVRRCVVHADQYRLPVGQVVRSNPSGMTDGEPPAVAALREVAEEVGADIRWGPVVSMHKVVLGTDAPLLVSPGASDEEVTFLVVEGQTSPGGLDALTGRFTGVAEEGERIRLHTSWIIRSVLGNPLKALTEPHLGRPDAKALLSLLMYNQYVQVRGR